MVQRSRREISPEAYAEVATRSIQGDIRLDCRGHSVYMRGASAASHDSDKVISAAFENPSRQSSR